MIAGDVVGLAWDHCGHRIGAVEYETMRPSNGTLATKIGLDGPTVYGFSVCKLNFGSCGPFILAHKLAISVHLID